MHNNYYFLRQLTRSLEAIIKGAVVSECFSQNKNELIIRFEINSGSFYIKASLQPDFSCLSFSDEFSRARKNSVDLFESLIGQHVLELKQNLNERSFSIRFTEESQLLFKLHGNRSNLILFREHEVTDLFRKKLIADRTLDINSMDRSIDWSFDNFKASENNLEKTYFTFGKVIWKYLGQKGFYERSTEEKWEIIQRLLLDVDNSRYFITELDGTLTFSLVNIGSIQKTFDQPIVAINTFFSDYNSTDAFVKEKSKIISALSNQLTGSDNYLKKTQEKLEQIKADDHYKIWADLIMANLHAIKSGITSIQLPDFYNNNQLREIKLRKDLSPQKNAELYYKKARNHSLEIEFLERTLAAKEKEIKELEESLEKVKDAETLKDLKGQNKSLNISNTKTSTVTLPYHEFIQNGFKIWVGKNAARNDELTLKYSYKEDLWLHAKDVSGSHVVVKYQAGKKFPKDVIERAAQLAAYNSKRKNETLCPVIVTPKKYVRKRKGDPPGAVVVEKEDVIMVEPRR